MGCRITECPQYSGLGGTGIGEVIELVKKLREAFSSGYFNFIWMAVGSLSSSFFGRA